MKAKEMVKYTFTITGKVSVTLQGTDIDENYDIAQKMALKQALKQLDEDWIYDVSSEELMVAEAAEEVA
jgi:hypothetical protein